MEKRRLREKVDYGKSRYRSRKGEVDVSLLREGTYLGKGELQEGLPRSCPRSEGDLSLIEATHINVRSTFGWVTTSEKFLNGIRDIQSP
jgi:hypothetical protein